jgi:hypothetical protein
VLSWRASYFPAQLIGNSVDDIVNAAADYSRLDAERAPVRMPLRCTSVAVEHIGSAATAQAVDVSCVRADATYAVAWAGGHHDVRPDFPNAISIAPVVPSCCKRRSQPSSETSAINSPVFSDRPAWTWLDIRAITVTRWPHGYDYECNPLWDPDNFFWTADLRRTKSNVSRSDESPSRIATRRSPLIPTKPSMKRIAPWVNCRPTYKSGGPRQRT